MFIHIKKNGIKREREREREETCRMLCLKVLVILLHPSMRKTAKDFNILSKPGTSTNLWQLVTNKLCKLEIFDRFGILSKAMQFVAYRLFKLVGKSGID